MNSFNGIFVISVLVLILLFMVGCESSGKKEQESSEFIPKNGPVLWLGNITILSKEKDTWNVKTNWLNIDDIWYIANEQPEVQSLNVQYVETNTDEYGNKLEEAVATVRYGPIELTEMRKYREHRFYRESRKIDGAYGAYIDMYNHGLWSEKLIPHFFRTAYGKDMNIEFHGKYMEYDKKSSRYY